MSSGPTTWYRLADKRRTEKQEMLRSKAGRFHGDPVEEPTTYAGDSIETVWAEVRAHLPDANPKAFRLWEVKVPEEVFKSIVDLRKEEQRENTQVSNQELESIPADERLIEIARKLRGEGLSGIVYASVRNKPDGCCLVLFLEGGAEGLLDVKRLDDEWVRFQRET